MKWLPRALTMARPGWLESWTVAAAVASCGPSGAGVGGCGSDVVVDHYLRGLAWVLEYYHAGMAQPRAAAACNGAKNSDGTLRVERPQDHAATSGRQRSVGELAERRPLRRAGTDVRNAIDSRSITVGGLGRAHTRD